MWNNQSFNNVNDKLNINDKTKRKWYPLLSTLNVLFTSYTKSTLLYKIVKLSKEFSICCIMNIKHPQESTSKVIDVPK